MTSESIFRGHHFYYTEELYILNTYFFTHLLAQDDNIHVTTQHPHSIR